MWKSLLVNISRKKEIWCYKKKNVTWLYIDIQENMNLKVRKQIYCCGVHVNVRYFLELYINFINCRTGREAILSNRLYIFGWATSYVIKIMYVCLLVINLWSIIQYGYSFFQDPLSFGTHLPLSVLLNYKLLRSHYKWKIVILWKIKSKTESEVAPIFKCINLLEEPSTATSWSVYS